MRARLKAKPRGKQPEPDINITPLVDVVLVLLIIFMVVTPALNNDMVNLPAITKPDEKPKTENAIEITLTRDGSYVYDQKRTDDAALKQLLAELRAGSPDRHLLLKTDVQVPYSQVRKTLSLFQDLGFRGVSLKVEQGNAGEET